MDSSFDSDSECVIPLSGPEAKKSSRGSLLTHHDSFHSSERSIAQDSSVSLSQHAHQPINNIVPVESVPHVKWFQGRGRKSKIINDPVHGYMRFSPEVVGFIDTRQFQRLRDLKQLGVNYLVFPGASHNRFEHCLGVCHLAHNWMCHLEHMQPSLVTEQDKLLVSVAGLLHDLGHGPFSHVFDNEFIPAVNPGSGFSHEAMGCRMFDWLVDENNIDMDKEERECIKSLIVGHKRGETPPSYFRDGKMFLFDIVANGRCSVDVDKFDYIPRDCMGCNVKASCDFTRIWHSSKIIDDEVCFHEKEAIGLYDLFHTRATLHKRVYSHKKAKAVEYMIRDALIEANCVLRISDKIHDPEEFWTLTDCIIKDIEISTDPALQKSRDIILRLRRRQLYHFCGEFIVPESHLSSHRHVTEADILRHLPPGSPIISRSELIVHNMEINYGLKGPDGKAQNPIDFCHFFSDWNSNDKISLEIQKVSTLLVPRVFSEKCVRVYCLTPNVATHSALQQALQRLSKALHCDSPYRQTTNTTLTTTTTTTTNGTTSGVTSKRPRPLEWNDTFPSTQ